MFIVRDSQIEMMRVAKLEKVVKVTMDTIKLEFPELVTLSESEINQVVSNQIKIGSSIYKIKAFDLLEDFAILSLQRPILLQNPLPDDLNNILTWPNMEENDKLAELEKLLNSKY